MASGQPPELDGAVIAGSLDRAVRKQAQRFGSFRQSSPGKAFRNGFPDSRYSTRMMSSPSFIFRDFP